MFYYQYFLSLSVNSLANYRHSDMLDTLRVLKHIHLSNCALHRCDLVAPFFTIFNLDTCLARTCFKQSFKILFLIYYQKTV